MTSSRRVALMDPAAAAAMVASMPTKRGPLDLHVVFTHDGRWWTAEAPALRGAYSQGRTRASALRNLRGAIADLLASYADAHRDPPFADAVAIEITRLAL